MTIIRSGRDVKSGRDVRYGRAVTPLSFGTPAIWTRGDDPDIVIGDGDIELIPNRGSTGGAIIEAGAPPTATALNKRQWSALFDGIDDYLVDDWATASNKFLHDGTGCTLFVVVRKTSASSSRLIGTVRNNTSQIGMHVYTDATGTITFRVLQGGGASALISDVSSVDAAPVDTTRVLWLKHKTGETPEWIYGYDVVTEASGSYTGTPSAANPTRGLELGRVSSSNLEGHIPELVAYPDYLADADIQSLVKNYLQPKWVRL